MKLGSCCSVLQQEGTVVSVAGVPQEVSKQTHAINKSEVYSHYFGLLFRRILGLTAHQGGGVGAKQGRSIKTKGSVEKNMWLTGRPTGH